VGVFGHSGRSEFVHDEKGTIIFHGTNATYGDKEERRSFKGNIDGHEFTDATIVRTGNTFTVTGHVRGGGWVTVDGHVSTEPDGKTRYVSQSFRDTAGGKFTPESAFSQLVTYHSVPEAALRDTQTKTAFARALVEQMRYLRGESYNLSKISSVGLSGHLSTARSSGISSKSGDEKVGGGKAGASVGLTSNVQRRTMVSEDVDIQFREVMKILDKHDNTTEGRKTAGSDLLDFYDNSAGNSSTRETSMLSGGSWKRKDRAR
jgi:hypothetical protein